MNDNISSNLLNLKKVNHVYFKYQNTWYDPNNKEQMKNIIVNMTPRPDDNHLNKLSDLQLDYFLSIDYNSKSYETRKYFSPYRNVNYVIKTKTNIINNRYDKWLKEENLRKWLNEQKLLEVRKRLEIKEKKVVKTHKKDKKNSKKIKK